jgi:hypothetical protein
MAQPPGPYGAPPRPPRIPLLPWVIVALAVLVSGLGILLVILLTADDPPAPPAAATTSGSESSSATTESSAPSSPRAGRVLQPKNTEGGRFPGSGDVAFTWFQAMAAGDFRTAYDLSCTEVQDTAKAAAAADGADPAETLGPYFFQRTLGGEGFSEGTLDSIEYSSGSDSDIATFALRLDSGQEFLLLVYVTADGSVCDFI